MKRIKELYKKYEHYASITAFLLGFVIDNFTLTRIDLLFENLVFATYLLAAGLGIFVFQYARSRRKIGWLSNKILIFAPLVIQFAFGGLFSGYFVFYSRSASFAASWLFVLMIALLIGGNEFFKKRYARLEFQISIFFIALFSFAIFYIPIIVHSISAWVFILSGVVSLALIRLFVLMLSRVAPDRVGQSRKRLFTSILSIYFIFNALYFTNIIPPIPLSLKDMDVYYSVERVGGGYSVTSEKFEWYEFYKKFKDTYYSVPGNQLYLYSAVFSPTDLDITIFHKWQYFDERKDEWVESDRLGFEIVGGRDGGYRGYSKKTYLSEGKWRVDVITERNQVIGRKTFKVEGQELLPELVRDTI